MSSKSNPDVIAHLDKKRGKIFSKTGGWFPGKAVYSHGYSMLDELVGEKTYFQIMILNATGKLVEKPVADWVEGIYACLSWPDPRIWCNQIGALAGASRASALAATTAGVLATDSRSYGVLPIIEGVTFIQQAKDLADNGKSPEEIIQSLCKMQGGKPAIVGYRRPIASGDERLEAMERVSKKLEMDEGEHLQLAYRVENFLLEKYNEGMNINGYVAARMSDFGFTSEEIYNMYTTAVASGVTACYLEEKNRGPDEFLPLQCNDIDYIGADYRPVNK